MRGSPLKRLFEQRRLMAVVHGRPKPRIRRGRVPRPKLPIVIEQEYAAFALSLLRKARKLVESRLLPQLDALARQANPNLRADAGYADTVEQIVQALRAALAREITDPIVSARLRAFARRIEGFAAKEVEAQIKRIASIDILAVAGDVAPAIDAFTKQNIGLIKSIPEKYLADVEATVMRHLRAGQRSTAIAEDIRKRFDVSQSRATLIARDQVNKFNGEMVKHKHEALGVRRYIWRTSQDERVRSLHVERNGKIFSYDDPPNETPDDGHPGQPIQCRCTADPIIEDVLGEPLSSGRTGPLLGGIGGRI